MLWCYAVIGVIVLWRYGSNREAHTHTRRRRGVIVAIVVGIGISDNSWVQKETTTVVAATRS